MMREKPILFSGAMVRAILDGSKTVTRRVVAGDPQFLGGRGEERNPDRWGWPFDEKRGHGYEVLGRGHTWRANHDLQSLRSPYGEAGDHLWVRETWGFDSGVRHDFKPIGRHELSGMDLLEHTLYLADRERTDVRTPPRWRPSIHMPRWASRINLEVTGIAVERLQDITEEQAKAEGIVAVRCRSCVDGVNGAGTECQACGGDGNEHSSRELFVGLWESINGKRPGCSWADNPWCWAVSFRRLTP